MLTEGRQVLAIILEELVGKILSVNKEGVTKRLTELTNETPAAKTRFSWFLAKMTFGQF